MLTAIQNAVFFTGITYIKDKSLVFENEKIIGFFDNLNHFDELKILDYKNKICLPGYIDLQINGGAGLYFVKDFSTEAIAAVAGTFRKYGTTSFMPTLVSTRMENLFKGIESVKSAIKDSTSGVLGIHIEGPYLNPVKRGAHLLKYLRTPDLAELEKLIIAGEDTIGLLTIAPELFMDEQMKLLRESKLRLSAGHSNATYSQAKDFYKKGISKVTHLFNAMSAFQSREPGLVGAFFDSPELYGAIIADGRHVDYAALRVAHRLKKGKLFFVSDAVFVDFTEQHFKHDGFNIRLKDGAFVNEENKLAGAAISIQDAIFNSINYAQIPEAEAFKMATSIPAAYLGMSDEIGNLKKGAYADFVILDKDYRIEEVFFRGKRNEQ